MKLLRTWLALAHILVGAPALAIEPTDPSPLQRMSAGIVTSRCVGRTDTPLCAAETFLSCLVRADHRHCAAVGAPPLTMYPLPGFREYRLRTVSTVTDWRRDPMGAFVSDTPPPTMQIVLNERSCPRTGCRGEPWKETLLELRLGAAGWRIWYWASGNGIEGFTSRERVTSRCRGDPRSPLCLVEGIFSCVMRGEYEHCLRGSRTHAEGLCFRKPGWSFSYEVTELGFPGFTNGYPFPIDVRLGGILQECRAGTPCGEGVESFEYSFAREGKTWLTYSAERTDVERCLAGD